MNINAEIEKNLVQRLNQGDEVAFSHLFSMYRGQLFYYCIGFLKEKTIAEDLTQEIFLTIWDKRESVDAEKSFSAFLYTIAKNQIYDTFRSLNARSRIYQALLEHAVDYTKEVEEKLEEKNMQELLQEALRTLTDRQQEVFRLSREKGLSNKEIAEELSLSVYTVQDHIRDALAKIRSYLLKYLELYPIILWVVLLKFTK